MTGATGFVGSHVIEQALASGHSVRAITRSPRENEAGVEWITGTLEDAAALAALVDGADAVLHIAGAVNVPTREAFAAANIAGTQAIVDAAVAATVRRFVHTSTIAARQPDLSNYGWSKAGAEEAVRASPLDWTVVRPPAVYGPRDRDMLDLFRMARRGVILLPPHGRTSIIHVADLAALLLRLTVDPAAALHQLFEPDDGAPGGYSHREFGQLIGRAVGRPGVIRISAPRPLLHLAGRGDRLVRGAKARMTPDRASYMSHADWVADPALAPPHELWQAQWCGAEGLAMTAEWYRAAGWL